MLLVRWVVAIGIGIVVVAGIVAFFSVDVCDQQLSNRGSAVQVCRHLQASDPPVIALGLVLLLALSVFFTEISGFGVTLKREVREAAETAEEAKAAAEENRAKIQQVDEERAELGEQVLGQPQPTVQRAVTRETLEDLADLGSQADEQRQTVQEPVAGSTAAPDVQTLAHDYNRLRLTMPSGDKRTQAMERVVQEMISVLKNDADFDVEAHLTSTDRGLRLAGYAYLYDHPDAHWTQALVASLIDREDKPFGQYWALRALRRQCEADPTALDSASRRRLEEDLRPKIGLGFDRNAELQRVLDGCH